MIHNTRVSKLASSNNDDDELIDHAAAQTNKISCYNN